MHGMPIQFQKSGGAGNGPLPYIYHWQRQQDSGFIELQTIFRIAKSDYVNRPVSSERRDPSLTRHHRHQASPYDFLPYLERGAEPPTRSFRDRVMVIPPP